MSEAITKAAQEAISPELQRMTAHRAVFFLERFKKEEKMLGPNEQAALDFAMAALYQAGQGGQVEVVAWMRKTDITEIVDTEPESDGWTPLYAAQPAPVPAPVASVAAYFSFGDDSGYVEHSTAEAAIEQAKADLKGYSEDAMQDNEWPLEVESVCWGVVLQKAAAVDNSEAAGQPSFEYELGGSMTVAQQPAPAEPAEPLLQAGLSNDQLREAFAEKIPGVEPSDRDLSIFALGAEVGAEELADQRRMSRMYFDERNSARDAWRRAADQREEARKSAAVPAGWQLVPVDPTMEMLGAFFNACPMLGDDGDWESATDADRQEVAKEWAAPWTAMLSAAPKPAVKEGV